MPGTALKDIFTAVGNDMLDLLSKMLTLNPLKRSTATEVSGQVAPPSETN